jgi:predicted NBD/HSP70 family sugar kinase
MSDKPLGANGAEVARSSAYLRQVNERTVFKRVCELAPTSVTQLVQDTGLSKPTVGLTLAHLEEVGLIQRLGTRTGQAGRAPQLFGPRPEAGWVVAVDVGRHWVGVLLADLTGAVVAQLRRRSPGGAQGLPIATAIQLTADQISGLVDDVLAGTDLAAEDVLSVVVGSPGVYDASEGRLQHASNLPGWERPELVASLRERLGEHIVFENDVDLAALGEQAFGLGQGIDDFVYLSIGSGLGIGAVLGGRLHRGAHGTAGELAFLPVGPPGTGRGDGLVGGWAGGNSQAGQAALRQGLLESVAAADGLVAAAQRHGLAEARRPEDVLAAARAEHPAAVRAMDEELDHLTAGLASIVALLDPELVVFGGGIGRNLHEHLPALRQRLAELLPLPQPRFAVSALGDDATLLGGLASGLSTARERALSRAENA